MAIELEKMSELHLLVLSSVGKSDFQLVSLSVLQLEPKLVVLMEFSWDCKLV
jgi:hypothetical protein